MVSQTLESPCFRYLFRTLCLASAMVGLLVFPALSAQLPIHYRCDNLEVSSDKQEIQLNGNAQVTQGDSSLHADRIRILLNETDKKTPSASQIREMIATGNVQIRQLDMEGTCDTAHYTEKNQEMVLTGTPALVNRSELALSGKKIRYNRTHETLVVFSGGTEPTTAQITLKNQDGSLRTVHVKAEHQMWSAKDRNVEFSGSVVVTEPETRLTAQRVRIHYTQMPDAASNDTEEAAIDSLHAQGEVSIAHPQGTAFGDVATYDGATRIITLNGNPARLEKNGSQLWGPTVLFDRTTGNFQFIGGASGRLFPEGDTPAMTP